VGAEPIFDILAALAEGSRDVSDAVLAVLFAEHTVEELARLLVVRVRVGVRVPANLTRDGDRRPLVALVLPRCV